MTAESDWLYPHSAESTETWQVGPDVLSHTSPSENKAGHESRLSLVPRLQFQLTAHEKLIFVTPKSLEAWE